jgi:sodium/bile acid cotransporter 7
VAGHRTPPPPCPRSIIVFLISGLVLKTEDIRRALSYWPGIAYGLLAILGLTPLLGFALRELPLSPPDFAVGLTVFAAVPTTLGVGEALVRASGGNTALALLLLVSTNALGVATIPPWLKALLSGVEGLDVSLDALNMFLKLLVTVLVPAVVGKAARELLPPVARFANRYKQPLGMLSTIQLALIIWQTMSSAQDVLVHTPFIDIFVVIVVTVLMHALYLLLNGLATRFLLRMPLKEAIAATIMSSQKSAPVAVTAISYLTSNPTQQGLLAVPCIVGQLAQIFMGSGFAPFLKARVQRQERLQAAAATDAPNPAEQGQSNGKEPKTEELEAARNAARLEEGISGGPCDSKDSLAAGTPGGGGEGKGEGGGELELATGGAGVPDAARVAAAASAEEGDSQILGQDRQVSPTVDRASP